jgi:peptide-methionine (S)-S-oxide reductase
MLACHHQEPAMSRFELRRRHVLLGGLLCGLFAPAIAVAAEAAIVLPPPTGGEALKTGGAPETVVLAGGCFWGVQGVYQHLKGVTKAVSGYAGGTKESADYDTVSAGRTDHAEAVEVVFDPGVVILGTILQVYFSVAHDPTTLNRQGPDVGPQYRSAIFAADDGQRRVAEGYMAQLGKAGVFRRPIVTQLNGAMPFYPAETYHQDYATTHPTNPYIAFNDRPKIDNLKRLFPGLYRDAPVLVGDARPQG